MASAIKCAVEGCEFDADGAIAVEVYPYQALMEYYEERSPLSKMMTTLAVCRPHAPPKVSDMFRPDDLKAFISTIEASSGVSVDMEACRIVLVPFTDPDYIKLKKQRR